MNKFSTRKLSALVINGLGPASSFARFEQIANYHARVNKLVGQPRIVGLAGSSEHKASNIGDRRDPDLEGWIVYLAQTGKLTLA